MSAQPGSPGNQVIGCYRLEPQERQNSARTALQLRCAPYWGGASYQMIYQATRFTRVADSPSEPERTHSFYKAPELVAATTLGDP